MRRSQSFLRTKGCYESADSQDPAASPTGIIVGARSDPGMAYGRFFNGTINEMMVFDRALSPAERGAVEAGLASKWSVPTKNVSACNALQCDGGFIATAGPSAAMVAHMEAFVAAAAAEPLKSTLIQTMVSASLAYLASAKSRCQGLNAGTIQQLRSIGANKASIVQLAATSASVATGVANYVQNTLARLASSDPLAAQLVKLWNSTATTTHSKI